MLWPLDGLRPPSHQQFILPIKDQVRLQHLHLAALASRSSSSSMLPPCPRLLLCGHGAPAGLLLQFFDLFHRLGLHKKKGSKGRGEGIVEEWATGHWGVCRGVGNGEWVKWRTLLSECICERLALGLDG